MGLADFYSFVREVDPGWLQLTVEGGYLWSLVAWTAVTFGIGALVGGIVEKARRRLAEAPAQVPRQPSKRALDKAARNEKRQAVAGFSRDMARAVLAAYEANGLFDVGDHWYTVRNSYYAGEGIFAPTQSALIDDACLYSLTGEWRAFLDNPRELERVRQRAGC